MDSALYLTKGEQKIFGSLSRDLQEGWKVEEETEESYESLRQIAMRYQMADLSSYPEVEKIAEAMKAGKDLSSFSLDDLPQESLKELFFVMGARGVNSLIQTLIHELKNYADVEALSALSTVRHELLSINASATHS